MVEEKLDENFKELVEENVNLPKKRKRRTKKEIENFYVDPVGMELRIREFYKTGVMCKQLGEDINNIAQRLGYAPNFINYCVDEQTQALTKRGWLDYKQITTNDVIRAYDITSGKEKWSKIKSIFINENYEGEMYRINHLLIDALVTPGHNWVAVSCDTDNGKHESLYPIEHIQTGDSIVIGPDLYATIQNGDITKVSYKGVVWCPETEYGTFTARRNGHTYLTGNSFKEEMVSEALVQMVNALNRKTFKIGYNPFSYFTKIAYHAFVNTIKKEKKNKQALLMYQEQCHREMENDGIEVRRKREDPISSCLQEKYFSEE